MTKSISIKSIYGNYNVITKEFNDEKHLYNWLQVMMNKGHKIIGIH